jgi:hypothetical protein
MPVVTIDQDRLARITTLSRGSHDCFEAGVCAMEAVAYIAHEPLSDAPNCASPVIGAFIRAWNDALSQDDRDALILPLVPRLVGTSGSEALENRRAALAADWLVRVHAPAWLRLAGLTTQAQALVNLPEIVDFANTARLYGPLEAAQKHAAAARGAIRDAGWDVDWDAALDTAKASACAIARAANWVAAADVHWAIAANAAWVTAWAAAETVAAEAVKDQLEPVVWAAANAANWAAAKTAANEAIKAKLEPTQLELQNSALALVERMIRASGDITLSLS